MYVIIHLPLLFKLKCLNCASIWRNYLYKGAYLIDYY